MEGNRMRCATRLALAFCSIVGIVPTAAAQDLVGQDVRLTLQPPEGKVRGRVLTLDAEHLVLQPKGLANPLEISRVDVVRTEVHAGRKRNVLKGAIGGALAWGALVGLVAAFDTLDESGVGEPLLIGGMIATGAGVGFLIQTDKWQDHELPPAGVSSLGPRRGLRAAVTIRF
jgi:hypothetical protein